MGLILDESNKPNKIYYPTINVTIGYITYNFILFADLVMTR